MSFDGKGMKKVAIFDATDTLMELSEPVGDTYWKLAAKHSLSPSGGADGLMLRFKEEYQKMKPIDYPSIGPGHAQKAEISWWRELVRKVFASEDSPVRESWKYVSLRLLWYIMDMCLSFVQDASGRPACPEICRTHVCRDNFI